MKNWYQSKTILFNILALVVMIAGAFGFGGFTPSPEVQEIASVLMTVMNIVLRFYTSKSIQ